MLRSQAVRSWVTQRIPAALSVALAAGLSGFACSGESSDLHDGVPRAGAGGSAARGGNAGSSGSAGLGGSAASSGGSDPCRPIDCSEPGACGRVPDGCGDMLECEPCSDACAPTTCAAEGADCGSIPNGCGGMLECGSCDEPETCGGGGDENVCGCEPTTCEDEGYACGEHDDGCGGTLDCGSCPDGCSCSAGGRCAGGSDAPNESTRHGQAARSAGFTGTDSQYNELYDFSCFSVDDCAAPCLERGGSEEMCGTSECIDSEPNYCLPTPVWRNLSALLAEGDDVYADGAELVLVNHPYRDSLYVEDFKFEIPEHAEIEGITVTVRRAAGGADEAVDAAVRLIKGGVVGESDRSSPMKWAAPDFVNAEYGGPTDLWGQTWSPEDVNAPDFGVGLSVAFAQTGGNGRAYVDIVYVTVHYSTACR